MRRGTAIITAASLVMGLTAGMSFSAFAYDVDELKVAIWDNNQLAGIQEIADEWTKESGVKVQIDVVNWDNYWTLLEAGASDQSGMPDVFWMHSNVAQMYMENDILLPIDEYVEADDKIDLANYYEGVTDLFTRKDNGVLYALPKDHDTIALLYNKAIFDKYGVDYPTDEWTWEDVRDAAKAITEAGADDGAVGQVERSLYQTFAEGTTADDDATVVVLDGTRENLAGRGRAFVDEDDEFAGGVKPVFLAPPFLTRRVYAFGEDDKFVFGEELVDEFNGGVEVASRVATQVEDERLHALSLQFGKSLHELLV